MRTKLLGKPTALIVLAAAIALCTTACFPDAAPGEPASPYVRGVYQAINQDRATPDSRHSSTARISRTSPAPGRGDVGRQLAAPPEPVERPLQRTLHALQHPRREHHRGTRQHQPQQLEAAWMNSAPHGANVLNRNYNVVGIGVFYGPDGRGPRWSTSAPSPDPRGRHPVRRQVTPSAPPDRRERTGAEVRPDPSSPIR